MFASYDAPFGGDESLIQVNLAGTGRVTPGPYSDSIVLNVAFLDDVTRLSLGPVESTDPLTQQTLCCSRILNSTNSCGPGVGVGGLIRFNGRKSRDPVVASFPVDIASGTPLAGATGRYNVMHEGTQYVLIVACDAKGTYSIPPYQLSLDVSFKNPYGYLPGQMFGFLPMYGVLFVAYLLATIVYSVQFCRQRKHLLSLQYGVLALIVLGMFEMAVWFFTYNAKNETGVPTPCDFCGPTTSDYMAAVVINVIKRAVSRCTLLAVALGYGVVHASLSRKVTILIGVLTLAYFIFGTLNEVEKTTSYELGPTAWELPVFFCDAIFYIGINQALHNIQRDLTAAKQLEKLRMYNQLTRVITVNALAFIIIDIIVISIREGAMPLPWKSLFFLVRFWDIIYFAVLMAVAYIWAPGPTAYQYSLYSQPPTGDDEFGAPVGNINDAGGDVNGGPVARPESIGIEMTAADKAEHGIAQQISGAAIEIGSGPDSSSSEDADIGNGSRPKHSTAVNANRAKFVIAAEDDDDSDHELDLTEASDRAKIAASSSARPIDVRPLQPASAAAAGSAETSSSKPVATDPRAEHDEHWEAAAAAVGAGNGGNSNSAAAPGLDPAARESRGSVV